MSGDLAKQRLFSISVISSSKSGQRGALQQRVCFPTRFSGIDKVISITTSKQSHKQKDWKQLENMENTSLNEHP